jgi:hypothetical protein
MWCPKKEKSVNQTPEFLEGPIARDYREILESAPYLEAATKKKAVTGKNCSVPKVCAKAATGKSCSVPKICPKAVTGKNCSVPQICPKAMATDALPPAVPGWSLPPAPPAA